MGELLLPYWMRAVGIEVHWNICVLSKTSMHPTSGYVVPICRSQPSWKQAESFQQLCSSLRYPLWTRQVLARIKRNLEEVPDQRPVFTAKALDTTESTVCVYAA